MAGTQPIAPSAVKDWSFLAVPRKMTPIVVADAWVKEIPMKSNMVDQAGSIMINKNTFEFKARYNPNLWAALERLS